MLTSQHNEHTTTSEVNFVRLLFSITLMVFLSAQHGARPSEVVVTYIETKERTA